MVQIHHRRVTGVRYWASAEIHCLTRETSYNFDCIGIFRSFIISTFDSKCSDLNFSVTPFNFICQPGDLFGINERLISLDIYIKIKIFLRRS